MASSSERRAAVDGAGGYAVERDYVTSFQREAAPARLRAVLVLRRRAAVEIDRPFRYLELGCGRGFTLAALAAANPQGEFVGVDISPDHVAHARRVARTVGIGNVTYLEASFAELLEGPDRLGEFDFAFCHGVWAWIAPEERARAVELLRRHLVTTGLLHLGYNAMPGWASAAPIRELIRRLAAGRAGAAREAAIGEAASWLRQLQTAGAGVMRDNPALKAWLGVLERGPAAYRVHEWLPEAGGALWHHAVAEELSRARLGHVGSARLLDDLDLLNFDDALRARIDEADAAGLGETFRDLAANRTFRYDVFARGAPRLNAAEAEAALEALEVAAIEPPEELPAVNTARGEVALADPSTRRAAEIVAEGPCAIGEACDRAAAEGFDRRRVRQTLVTLLASGRLEAVATRAPGAEAVAACARFNRAALAAERGWPALVSPILGGGLPFADAERAALAGRSPATAGLPEEARASLEQRLRELEARRPLLAALGVPPGDAP